MAAAQAYATVLADDGDDDVISLNRISHAVTRVLWQQRFFEQAMGARHMSPLELLDLSMCMPSLLMRNMFSQAAACKHTSCTIYYAASRHLADASWQHGQAVLSLRRRRPVSKRPIHLPACLMVHQADISIRCTLCRAALRSSGAGSAGGSARTAGPARGPRLTGHRGAARRGEAPRAEAAAVAPSGVSASDFAASSGKKHRNLHQPSQELPAVDHLRWSGSSL